MILVFSLLSGPLFAQKKAGKPTIRDGLVTVVVGDDGDSIFVANNLPEVSLSSPRKFKSREEYTRYRRYLRYAATVYPYAKEAIRIFREVEFATNNMKKRKRKKHVKKLQKELKEEFEEPLKKLSKTQGKILVKMIERETGKSMFQLIKSLRGGLTAHYWSTMSRFWGYRLKKPYKKGDDPILDVVLKDFNISYKMERGD